MVALVAGGCSCSEEAGTDGGLTDGALPDAGAADGAVRMRCGNGEVEGTEACDDGNTMAGDGCSTACTLECGDGEVNGDEICDTAIAAGSPGACPSGCDDADPCTTDTLSGSDCSAECVFGPITAAMDGDACCPAGQDATTDADCAATCGNGVVEGEEACDTGIEAGSVGACPSACDDFIDCTTDTLTMEGTCAAACEYTPITEPAEGDFCCPSGATVATDSDCAVVCGDGVVTGFETCDTAASGAEACPTSCDDGNVCTTDRLANPGTCRALCTSTAITAFDDTDGCCPPGATIADDGDCTGTCGDGAVSGGETCDTAASGADACPTMCADDGMACTTNTLHGDGTCSASCTVEPVTMPADGDGCCPPGESLATDADCPAMCGDGVVSARETCDTAIAAGDAGACPSACDDGDPCTVDMLANAGTCRAQCGTTPVAPGPMDSCCPMGADLGDDPDCTARCGDGIVTAPETCDDGNMVAGDGCSDTCRREIVGFRFTDLDLMDPHVFADAAGACRDVTNLQIAFLGIYGVNPTFERGITMDLDGDGELDLSVVHAFDPFLQAAGTTSPSALTRPDCTAPMSSTMCTLPMGATRTPGDAMNMGAGTTCLDIITGTVRPYTPAVRTPTAPAGGSCYIGNAGNVTFDLQGIPIMLEDASIGGVWSGTDRILNGLIRGFMSEAVADATIIPEGTTGQAAIDGEPLSSLLRGGRNSCSQPSPAAGDTDMRMGVRGWYFYLNFTAERVPYSEL